MTTEITGAAPTVSTYALLRDEIQKVAGVPFRRLLVYKLEVPMPLSENGVTLFKVNSGFTIHSITISSTVRQVYDSSYILYDIADGETIGVAEVREGKAGLVAVAVPDIPAGLSGPSIIYIKPLDGIQSLTGSLVFQISIYGPTDILGDGVSVDLNQDGIPDELAEKTIPLPPFSIMETYDDFYAGYYAGINGVDQQ